MSKRQNLLAVWQQIPVANRTVEVNTKTGFSLTAGSYSVRASSTQTAVITINTAVAATISSVTVTRALAHHQGARAGNTTGNFAITNSTCDLTNATTVTGQCKSNAGDDVFMEFEVQELF